MTFNKPEDVQCVLNAGREIAKVRGDNRVVIDNMANGVKPFDDVTAEKLGLSINVSFGEGVTLCQNARRQFTKAFGGSSRYFHIEIPDAPPEHKFQWEQIITGFINRRMKKSRTWLNVQENWIAGVVVHGIGPRMWNDKEHWEPEFVAINDLRVPTNTLNSFENCDWFARRVWYTEGELANKAYGKNRSKGWNKKAVADICNRIHDYKYLDLGSRWDNDPERMAQLVRQNGGIYTSDAAPSVPLWHFYYMEQEDEGEKEKWCLKVVVDTDLGTVGDPNDFLYDAKGKSQADSLDQILSVQIGDTNNVAPLLYNSIRSLGFQLVEPIFWSNLTRCRMMQHLNDQFNVWLRNLDPNDRSRAMAIEFFNKCVLPAGVTVVPQSERHQVDSNLIQMAFSQTKQLQSEVSSSYTSQADTGTNKEQTAYETAVKVAQVNAMMSGIITKAKENERFCYTEICRRFCIRSSGDEDVRDFQKAMKEEEIPEKWLSVDRWDVKPEETFGYGNPTMEMSIASQLGNISGRLSPQSQQKALNMEVTAITGSAAIGQDLVPINVQSVTTNGQKWAASIFGTLMQGVPAPQNEAVSALEQIDTLIGMLSGAIMLCEQQGNVCTRAQLNGFSATLGYCQQLVQQIGTDQSKGPLAKQYAQSLGELANILKGFAQRLSEEEAADQQDPEAQAKIYLMQQTAQVKNQSTQQKAHQSLTNKQAAFDMQQQQKAEQHALQQQVQAREAARDAQIARLETMVEAERAKLDIAITQARAEADIRAAERKASAKPEPAQAA